MKMFPWMTAGAIVALVCVGCGGNDDGSTASSTGGSGPSSSASTGGGKASSSSTSSGNGGATGANIGMPCTADGDCDDPSLTCLKDSDTVATFGGGIAGGYCSRPCATDAECPSSAHCFVQNGSGVCVKSCDFATPASMEDPDKCFGREDVACFPLHSTDGKMGSGCLPECGGDSQCPTGRFCRAATSIKSGYNVCTDQPGAGQPVGTACDLNAPNPCDGTCLSVGTGEGICTEPCRFWATQTSQCNDNEGFCYYQFTSPSGQLSGPGDVAYCTPRCTSNADCAPPTTYCYGNTTVDLCFTPTACPNGDADCAEWHQAGFYAVTCVQTADGPRCLDPNYQ